MPYNSLVITLLIFSKILYYSKNILSCFIVPPDKFHFGSFILKKENRNISTDCEKKYLVNTSIKQLNKTFQCNAIITSGQFV